MNKKVSIVIPYYNHWSLTHALLYGLFNLEKDNIHEIMLVDDASDEEGLVGGEKWWKDNGLLPVRVLRFDENKGFIKAANKGLKKATGDVKVLISNDVLIQQSFIPQILGKLDQDENQLIGNVYHMGSTGWNDFGGKRFPYLAGHFLAATSEVWEKLGYFDELYCPCCFEDVDLSTTALSMKIQLTSLNLLGITHLGGQTIKYTPERDELTHLNREKFGEKWLK